MSIKATVHDNVETTAMWKKSFYNSYSAVRDLSESVIKYLQSKAYISFYSFIGQQYVIIEAKPMFIVSLLSFHNLVSEFFQ